MSKEKKRTTKSARDWKRVLSLSINPRNGVTTVNRTYLIDVCVGKGGKPFFLLNSEFANMQPRDIARVIKAIADKKTYNNVFVHEECSFSPFKKEDHAARTTESDTSTADTTDFVDDFDDFDAESEDGDDF